MDFLPDRFHNAFAALATGLSAVAGPDIMRMALSAILGSAITYGVMVVRIEERQAVDSKAIAAIRTDIDILKSRAEVNATVNAQQQTTIELRSQQGAVDHAMLRKEVEELAKALRAHELEDKRRSK